MKVKDCMDYTAQAPDILSAEELANSADKKIEYFYSYKALYYWIDPYEYGDSGYYLIAYANDAKQLAEYCHAKGYNPDSDVRCLGGYEIVDIRQSLSQGRKCLVDKRTLPGG